MTRESDGHKELKDKAKNFLLSLGFDDIMEEYPTGVRYSDYYFIMNREVWVDVVGFKGGVRKYIEKDELGRYLYYPLSWDRIVLVECGDTPDGKLRTLARHFEEVYHLSYHGDIIRVKREPVRNCWEIE
jgi:hypothetical protein